MKKSLARKIHGLISEIVTGSTEAESLLRGIFFSDPKQCKDALERSKLKEFLEESEMEIMKELWVVSQNCLRVIKTIDKETLREFQEDSEVI